MRGIRRCSRKRHKGETDFTYERFKKGRKEWEQAQEPGDGELGERIVHVIYSF